MAKFICHRRMTREEIQNIFQKELGPSFRVKTKDKRIVILKNLFMGFTIHVNQNNGQTICTGPCHYFPSFGLFLLLLLVIGAFCLIFEPVGVILLFPLIIYYKYHQFGWVRKVKRILSFREEAARERKRIADLEAIQKREESERKLSDQWLIVDSIIENHSKTLSNKRRTMITADDYGVIDIDKWENEKKYFLDNVIHPNTGNDPLIMKPQEIIIRIDTILDQVYDDE